MGHGACLHGCGSVKICCPYRVSNPGPSIPLLVSVYRNYTCLSKQRTLQNGCTVRTFVYLLKYCTLPAQISGSVLCCMEIRRICHVRGNMFRVFWIVFCSMKWNGVILVRIVSSRLHARGVNAADAPEYRGVTSLPLRSGSLRK